jgi:hypothetical protein
MRVFERRGLTEGEIALARGMFGDGIAYRAVRIAQGPRFAPFGAMVPFGQTIVHGAWAAATDFAATSVDEQGWFIHEMTHVWQAARGVVLAWAKCKALGRSAYRFVLKGEDRFEAFNIEQQAEVARALFLRRRGHSAFSGAAFAGLEAVWPVKPGPDLPVFPGS